MAGTFLQRTNVLLNRVGSGKIEASVRVDQVYAQFQHQRTDLRHPLGGKSHYLTDPLITHFGAWYQKVASEMYEVKMQRLFIDIANDLNSHVQREAPKFAFELAYSGEPRVKESGRFVYRGPHVGRLSKAELKAKTRLWNSLYGRSR